MNAKSTTPQSTTTSLGTCQRQLEELESRQLKCIASLAYEAQKRPMEPDTHTELHDE